MADNSLSEMANDPKRKAKSNDVGWKYGFWPDLTNKDMVQCTLCGKKCHSGIKRLKQHLAGNYGDVAKCPKTTTEIMREMHEALTSKKRNKFVQLNNNDLGKVKKETSSTSSTYSYAASGTGPISETTSKKKKAVFQFPIPEPKQQKMDDFFLRTSHEEVVFVENNSRTQEEKDRVHMHIANFFYECGIPPSAADSKSYEIMVESIGQYGPGLIPPTYRELQFSLLEKTKKKMNESRQKHELVWERYGCTLMSDGWTDKKGRHLINFLVNSLEGTYFMDSVDATKECQDAELLAGLLDQKIEEIGPDNVVLLVTSTDTNYKTACQILMQKRPRLFWTPCVARCLDLMLEDIGQLEDFKSTITNGRRITTFISRHGRLLDAIRKQTKSKDLVIPTSTRFVATFVALECLYNEKDAFKHVFSGDAWSRSKLSAIEAGKQVFDLVLSTKFWDDLGNCMKASRPLLAALKIIDEDEISAAMPEVYAAMETAKQKIKDSFDDKRIYEKVIEIVECRWDTQMELKLYGAALFLNQRRYFDIIKENVELAYKLRDDFDDVLAKIVLNKTLQEKISNQADCYVFSQANFAKDMAIRQRKFLHPDSWWRAFGYGSFELAKIARRVVGLRCSFSGYERNHNMFDFVM